MLCMQQCVDLCDLSPEDIQAIRERATLAEILALQAACPHAQAAAHNTPTDLDAVANCGMLDIRDQLLEDVWAAEDFDDLEGVVHRYCDWSASQAADAG